MAETTTKKPRRKSQTQKYRGALTAIVKMAGDGKSKQIKDPFAELYGVNGMAIEPLLSPDKLLIVMEENAIHSACVQAKAADAVGGGWRLENKDPQNEDKSKESDLRDLLEDLTPEWSFSELLRQAAEEEESIGWSAWEAVREGDYTTDLNALFPMPAHTLRVTRWPGIYVQIRNYKKRYFVAFGYEGGPVSATLGIDGEGNPYEPVDDDDQASEIILFRSYAMRTSFYGMPRWLSALPAIAELTAIREYNISWFASGGTADRIIHITGKSDEEAEKVADDVKTQLEDSVGRGHVTIITHSEEGVAPNVVFLTQTTGVRDGQFMKRRDDLHKEVLIAHQVPSYRVGLSIEGALGGSAADPMLRAYKDGVVEPLQTILEDRLAHTLFGPKGLNLGDWKWVLEDLDYEETQLDLDVATRAVDSGLLTPNEARHRLKMERYSAAEADMLFYHGSPLASDNEEINSAVGVIDQFTQAITAAKQPPQVDANGKPIAGKPVPGGAAKQPPPKQEPAPTRKDEREHIEKAIEKSNDASRELAKDVLAGMVEIAKSIGSKPTTVTIEKGAVAVTTPPVVIEKGAVEVHAPITIEKDAIAPPPVTVHAPITIEKGAVESKFDVHMPSPEDPGDLRYDEKGRVLGFEKKK